MAVSCRLPSTERWTQRVLRLRRSLALLCRWKILVNNFKFDLEAEMLLS